MPPPGDFVDLGGQPVHVVTDAAGEPPIVLTAGLGGAWYDWSTLMPHLPPGHRVLRFDRPGLGSSPGAERVPTLSAEAERLAAVIRHVTPHGAVVVAHSLAGLHAEALARRCPSLVRGLVLVDPSNGPTGADPNGTVRSRIPLTTAARSAWSLARAADRCGLSARVGPAAFAATVRVLAREPVPGEVLTAGRRAFASAVPAAAACCELLAYRRTATDLAALREHSFPAVPAYVLTALGDLGRSAGRRWLDRHDRLAVELGARHRVLAGAGHFLAWHRPDAVAAAVADVVRRSL